MSNLTINRIGTEAQADSAWHDEDIEASRFSSLDVRPSPTRWRGRDLLGAALAGLAALGGWIILLVVFWVAARITENAYPPAPGWVVFWQTLLALTASTPLVMAVIGAAVWVYERRIYALRAGVIRDKLMNPVPAHLIHQLTLPSYYALFERAALLERDVAPYRSYRGVESLSLSTSAAKPEEPRKALESLAPVPTIAPSPAWIDEILATEAHIILAGRSGSGKTITAEALLARAIDRGDSVMIIDPHAAPNKWHGVATIGAARDYDAIRSALRALEHEMTERYAALARGEKIEPAALVIIDEVPAIAGALGSDWKQFGTRLGSEARKIGIRLALLTQSPLVEDIGMNSVMRRNFAIVGLDMASIRVLLRDEVDASVRRSILDALEGERYPAVREIAGQFHILDRRGLDRIRPTLSPNVWRLNACPEALTGATQTDRRSDSDIHRLKALIRQGMTRDAARAAGYEFDNTDWTKARAEVAAEDVLYGRMERGASYADNLKGKTV